MVRLALALALLVCLCAASAFAQATPVEDTQARARSLFERGVELVRQARWPEAEAAFREASLLVARPSVLYNLALALFELGRARESLAVLADLMAASDPVADARHRENAAALRERALARLAVLELRLDPAEAHVSVDGVARDGQGGRRTLQLDPGDHVIDVAAADLEPARIQLSVAAGDRVEQSVTLVRPSRTSVSSPLRIDARTRDGSPTKEAEPAASRPTEEPLAKRAEPLSSRSREGPSPHAPLATVPTLAWALVTTGAAVLVGALVTGVLAKDADDEFVAECAGTTDCDPALRAKQDEAARLALASDILLATGSAAVLGGIGVALLHDESGVRERPAGALLRVRLRL